MPLPPHPNAYAFLSTPLGVALVALSGGLVTKIADFIAAKREIVALSQGNLLERISALEKQRDDNNYHCEERIEKLEARIDVLVAENNKLLTKITMLEIATNKAA